MKRLPIGTYRSTDIDRRYVRGAPKKNVPNEATLDQ
jgi:hypothetical protein